MIHEGYLFIAIFIWNTVLVDKGSNKCDLLWDNWPLNNSSYHYYHVE